MHDYEEQEEEVTVLTGTAVSVWQKCDWFVRADHFFLLTHYEQNAPSAMQTTASGSNNTEIL